MTTRPPYRDLRPETRRFCPLCGGPLGLQAVPPAGRPEPVCGGCGFVFYLNPKLVACTLPCRDGRVLLIRRAHEPARGKWTFPGGFVDWGEAVEAAARRETREEVSVEVRLDGLHGVYSYPGVPVVIVVYLATITAGEPAAGPEVLETALVSPAEIPWDELAFPSTADALRDWVASLSGPCPP